MILKVAAVSAAIIMAGCTVTVPIIALSGQGPEVFHGTATTGEDGRGTLNLRGQRSGVLCYGAFMYTRRTGGAGAKGHGDAECDDGRKVRFEFFARSATVGTGTVEAGLRCCHEVRVRTCRGTDSGVWSSLHTTED